MAFKIIRATDKIVPKKIHLLIYGEPGAGKTSLACSADRPFLLDFNKEGFSRSANRSDAASISNWKEVEIALKDKLEEQLSQFGTIVIDTVQDAVDMILQYEADKNIKIANDPRKLYPKAKRTFLDFLLKIGAYNRTIIFIAHMKDEEDVNTKVKRPQISNSIREILVSHCDMIGSLTMSGENQRYLNFNPNPTNLGKNCANLEPDTVPDLATNPNYMAKVIERVKEGIGSVSELQASKMRMMEDIKNDLISCNNLKDFNQIIQRIKTHEESTSIKKTLANVLNDRANDFDAEYDPSIGLYKAKVNKEPAPKPKESPSKETEPIDEDPSEEEHADDYMTDNDRQRMAELEAEVEGEVSSEVLWGNQ